MVVMIIELVGANANADADDWVTTIALLDFVRRAKNTVLMLLNKRPKMGLNR